MPSPHGQCRCLPQDLLEQDWWRAASDRRRLLYVNLYLRSDAHGCCRASLNEMVEWMRTRREDLFGRETTEAPGRATIKDALAWLVEKGAIRRAVQGVQCVEIVQFVPMPDAKPDAPYSGEVPYERLIAVWNGLAEASGLPRARLTPTRRAKIRTRWGEPEFREMWQQAFQKAHTIPFYLGRNNTGWKATLGWLVKNSENYVKAAEAYDSTTPADHGQRGQAGGPATGGATNRAGRRFGGRSRAL